MSPIDYTSLRQHLNKSPRKAVCSYQLLKEHGRTECLWVGKDISHPSWWGAPPLALWSSCQQQHRTAAMNTGRVSNITWQRAWCSQTKVKHSNSFLLTLTTCGTSTAECPLWEQKLKVQITIFWNDLNFKTWKLITKTIHFQDCQPTNLLWKWRTFQ